MSDTAFPVNLEQAFLTVQDLLQTYVQSQDFRLKNLIPAFGIDVNRQSVRQLRRVFRQGDLSSLPNIEIRSGGELQGALGAYVSELDRIFLNREFLKSATQQQIVAVLLEEFGHAIDARINTSDSDGDEGAIFSALVRGQSLSEDQLQALRQENDTVELTIEGKTVQAEASISYPTVTVTIDEPYRVSTSAPSLPGPATLYITDGFAYLQTGSGSTRQTHSIPGVSFDHPANFFNDEPGQRPGRGTTVVFDGSSFVRWGPNTGLTYNNGTWTDNRLPEFERVLSRLYFLDSADAPEKRLISEAIVENYRRYGLYPLKGFFNASENLIGHNGQNLIAGGLGDDVISGLGTNDNTNFAQADITNGVVVEVSDRTSETRLIGYDVEVLTQQTATFTNRSGDFLFGNEGNDYLIAGSGDNLLDGGPGNDILFATVESQADNLLIGGDGWDFFVIDADQNTNTQQGASGANLGQTIYQNFSEDILGLTVGLIKVNADAFLKANPTVKLAVELAKPTYGLLKGIIDTFILGSKGAAATPPPPADTLTSTIINDFDPTEDVTLIFIGNNDSLNSTGVVATKNGTRGLSYRNNAGQELAFLTGERFQRSEGDATQLAKQLTDTALFVGRSGTGEVGIFRGGQQILRSELTSSDPELITLLDKLTTQSQGINSNFMVLGAFGPQAIYGTNQNDTRRGTNDWGDVLYGYNPNTTTDANSNDELWGLGGDDGLFGGSGDDKLYGGDGQDNIEAGPGNDLVVVASDIPTLYGSTIGGGDTISLGTGADTVQIRVFASSNGASNLTIESALGTLLANPTKITDFEIGDKLELDLTALGIANATDVNFINVNVGTDGLGDVLVYRTITGSNGFTTHSGIALLEDVLAEQLRKGTITQGAAGNIQNHNLLPIDIDPSVLIGPQTLIGTTNNDNIQGARWNDTIYGYDPVATPGGGSATDNDTLRGQEGDDTLYGGNGNDSLYGGTGNDQVFAGAGNDLMVIDDQGAFPGADNLYSGPGNDIVRVAASNAIRMPGSSNGADLLNFLNVSLPATPIINDFQPGVDKIEIDLNALGFSANEVDYYDVYDNRAVVIAGANATKISTFLIVTGVNSQIMEQGTVNNGILTIQAQVPTTPIITEIIYSENIASNLVTSDNSPGFKGTGAPGSIIEVSVDGTPFVGKAVVDDSGQWILQNSDLLPFVTDTSNVTRNIIADGNHTVTATATNGTTVSPSSSPLSFTVNNSVNTTLVVDTLTDEMNGDFSPGNRSLREALDLIVEGGTITFDPSLDGGTFLSDNNLDDLNILKSVTIDGGNTITLDGNDVNNAFDIKGDFDPATVDDTVVNFIGLTFQGGRNDLFDIDAATVNIISSSIDGHGGDINIDDSNVNIINTTITNGGESNALQFSDSGTETGASLNILNSTISGNESPGIVVNSGTVNIVNSTITGNLDTAAGFSYGAGGVHISPYGTSTVNIKNSIIAGNISNGASPNINGNFTSNGANIFGDLTGATGVATGDLTNVSISTVIDTTLRSNGGPTQTHALIANSPALDSGKNSDLPADLADLDSDGNINETIPFDQRGTGFDRTSSTAATLTADIGAFEVQSALNSNPTGSAIVTLARGEKNVAYNLTTSDFLQGFTDFDGNLLSVANLTSSNGTVVDNGDGTFTFTPTADFTGPVTFNYLVVDGQGGSVNANQSLIINTPPIGTASATLTDGTEDTPYTINEIDLLQGFTDANSDALSVANLSGTNGTVVDNADETFTFTPNADYNGVVELSYTVVDGYGGAVAATQSLNILTPATLVIAAFDVVNDHVLDGKAEINYTIENQGDLGSTSFTVGIVLSTDNIFGNDDDQLVGNPLSVDPLFAGDSTTQKVNMQLPKNVLNDHALTNTPTGQGNGYTSSSEMFVGLVINPDPLVNAAEGSRNGLKGIDMDDVTYFPWDIDGNGQVTPTDAIFTINRLGQTTNESNSLADFDGNGLITPTDAISVINRLGYNINPNVMEPTVV